MKDLIYSIKLTVIFIFFFTVGSAQESERLNGALMGNQEGSSKSYQAELGSVGSVGTDGNLSLEMPLLTVSGRSLSLPLKLGYRSGITADQQAGDVGLGWTLNFGSITRDYGAFEPDYTATAGELSATNYDDLGDGSLSTYDANGNVVSANTNPYAQHYNFAYNLMSTDELDLEDGGGNFNVENGMMPDDYHVNLSSFSNTFWNAGLVGEDHDFSFRDRSNWKVEFTKEVYTVPQELSRINEYNSYAMFDLNLNESSIFSRSYAHAICVPPYVPERAFSRAVDESDSPDSPVVGNEHFWNDEVVKYEDFGEFILTDPNGTQYVFGRALRGQKYLFSENPFWSNVPQFSQMDNGTVKSEFWKVDYVAEWLLTEIRSYDYEDTNGNGIADDDDKGDWIRIEYSEPEQLEWLLEANANGPGDDQLAAAHRQWSSLSQTDKATSLMRERAYVTRIVTPTQEAILSTSPRFEVEHDYFDKPFNQVENEYVFENLKYGTQGSEDDFDVRFPVELEKYDRIELFQRRRDIENYPRSGRRLGTVVLNYAEKGSPQELAVSNYLIRNNSGEEQLSDYDDDTYYADGKFYPSEHRNKWAFDIRDFYKTTGRGKTTLLGYSFYPTGYDDDEAITYEFHYDNNPSYDEFHKRNIVRQTFLPTIRQSLSPVKTDWNTIFYHTSLGGTPIEAYPHQLASIYPYEMKYHKYTFASEYQLANYIASADPSWVSGYNADVVNSMALVNAMGYPLDDDYEDGVNTAAWSLTGVSSSHGMSIDYDYENSVLSSSDIEYVDEQLYDSKIYYDYNDLAIERSRRQDAMNQMFDEDNWGNANTDEKQLTAAFEMTFDGVMGPRVHSKVVYDGVNDGRVTNYSYGEAELTGVPARLWNATISAFSSFTSVERRLHQAEKCLYHNTFLNYPVMQLNKSVSFIDPGWTTDYEVYMSPLISNYRVHNNVTGKYYFADRTDHFPNGSHTTYEFGMKNYGPVAINHEENQHLGALKGFDTEYPNGQVGTSFNGAKVYSVFGDNQGYDKVLLIEENRYEVGQSEPIYKKHNTYSTPITTAQKSHDTDELIIHTGGAYPCYMIAHQEVTDNNDIVEALLGEPLYFWDWYGVCGNTYPEFLIGTNYLTLPLQDLNWWQQPGEQIYTAPWILQANSFLNRSYSRNMTTEIVRQDGLEYRTELEYNDRDQVTTKTVYGSSYTDGGVAKQDIVIDEYTYGWEVYGALLEDYNIIDAIVADNKYTQTTDVANLTLAQVQTWEDEDGVPRKLKSYQYESNIDPVTGTLLLYEPFNFDGSNSLMWRSLSDKIEYNNFGQQVFARNARLYERSIPGYRSDFVKAHFSWDKEWFDATYTGYEDIEFDYDSEIGSNVDWEYWYEQNDVTVADPEERVLLNYRYFEDDYNDVLCEGSYSVHFNNPENVDPEDVVLVNVIYVDNSDGLFEIGDEIEVWKEDQWGVDQLIFQSEISSIIEHESENPNDDNWPFVEADMDEDYGVDVENHDYILCFEDPLCVDFSIFEFGANMPTGSRIKKTGAGDLTRRSEVTWIDSKTGENCYKLAKKLDGEPAERTPIRPVRIRPSGNMDRMEADIELERSASEIAEMCNIDYTASFWLKQRNPILQEHALRGPTSPQLATLEGTMASDDLKLVYELWNADHTEMIESGQFFVSNINSDWTYYEVDFNLDRAFAGKRWLYVYLENNIPWEINDPNVILVDDLLVYPTGAHYAYSSTDQKGGITDLTDMNHNSVTNYYDSWGRLSESYDANNKRLVRKDYHVTTNIEETQNYVSTLSYVDANKYSESRQYTDGEGKLIQSILTEPGKDIRRINQLSYDPMGWVDKTYLEYARVGISLEETSETDYLSEIQELYGSDHAFSRAQYRAIPGQQIIRNDIPRMNNEDDIIILSSQRSNETNVQAGDRVYGPGQLMEYLTTDPHGVETRVFQDAFGRTILTINELGKDYQVNDVGNINWINDSEVEYSLTNQVFDDAGNMIATIDGNGLQTTYTFNSLGQVVSSNLPDAGVTQNKYDKWGQLRFVKDADHQQLIDDGEYEDLFSFIKYDAWGRQTDMGVVKIEAGETALFDNDDKLQQQSFPQETETDIHELHLKRVYDGERELNQHNAISEEVVYSNHRLLGGEYVPEQVDRTVNTYDNNGLLSEQTFHFSELIDQPYSFYYTYNRMGSPTSIEFHHPESPQYSYIWNTQYDDLGRVVVSTSGPLYGTQKVDSENVYDVLGRLHRKMLSATDNEEDPYRDYVKYDYNIRGQLVSQLAKGYKYALDHDTKGDIRGYVWKNSPELLDQDEFFHAYRYSYDSHNRLVCADYLEQVDGSSWADGYDAQAHILEETISCEPVMFAVVEVALSELQDLLDDAEDNGILVSKETREALVDVIDLIQSELVAMGQDFDDLDARSQEAFLRDLFETARGKNIDLSELESISDQLERREVGAKGATKEQIKNTKKQIDTDKDFTKMLLKQVDLVVTMKCDINYDAIGLVDGSPIDYQSIAGNEVPKYDCSYWYDKAGNFETLNRTDDLGTKATLQYNFTTGTNQIQNIDWYTDDVFQQTSAYGYDFRGNLTSDQHSEVETISYNAFTNLPAQITKVGDIYETYRYNSGGQRTVKNAAGGETEYYMGPVVISSDGVPSRYSFTDGYLDTSQDLEENRNYLLTDWLGSTHVVLNNLGEHLAARDHYPFGKIMPARNVTQDPEDRRYQFTGHEFDEFTQYGYHGLRYYNREIARYNGVDPFDGLRKGVSPYNYTQNNPISRIDPTGGLDWEPDKDGNLIAEAGDDVCTLAEFLDTDEASAMQLLEDQGYFDAKGNLTLKTGDKVELDNVYTRNLAAHSSIPYGDPEIDYNCWGSACAGTQGVEIDNTVGISYPTTFDENLQNDYTSVNSSDAQFGETIVRFTSSAPYAASKYDHHEVAGNLSRDPEAVGGSLHGAVYYGTSQDGTIYIYTKNGWNEAPRIMKLTDLENNTSYNYGCVWGICGDSGFYNPK